MNLSAQNYVPNPTVFWTESGNTKGSGDLSLANAAGEHHLLGHADR